MSNQKITILHDDDGFLIGKKRLDVAQSKIDATYDTAKDILKAVKTPNARRVIVSGRVNVQNATKLGQKRSYNRAKVITNSQLSPNSQQALTRTLIQQTPAQKQLQLQEARKERRYQAAVSRSNQIQERLLKDINKNLMRNGGSSGLLGSLLPLLAAGGLAKGLFKLPLALGAGAAAAAAMRRKPPTVVAPNGRQPTGAPAAGKRSIIARSLASIGKGGAYIANKGGALLGRGGALLSQGGAALSARGGTLSRIGGAALNRGGALLSQGSAAVTRGGAALGTRSAALAAPRPTTVPINNSSMASFGKGFGSSLAKGGLMAAVMAAFSGVSVEKSDMDRADKNKSHFKNFFAAGGGVAGATGGAAIGASVGSIVPVVGTVVGGIVGAVVGGIGGSTLAEYFIEKVDAAIDPQLSRKMFGSWNGFIEVMGLASEWVWQQLLPTSVNTYFTNLGIDTSSYWSTVKDLATIVWDEIAQTGSMFWNSVTTSANMLWEENVPQFAKDFFEKLYKVGAGAFDFFKEGAVKLFDAIAKTPVGEALGDSWDWVKNTAGNAWDSAKEYVGWGDNSNVKGNERQQANDNGRRNGWTSKSVANQAVNNVMSATTQSMNDEFQHMGYNMGSKSLKGNAIDCSGWVNHVQQQTIDAINKSMGAGTISNTKKNEMRIAAANGGAAGIMQYAMKQGGVMQDDEITVNKLQDGMVLGMSKSKSHAGGRFKGIGHVVTVFTDPKTGKKMVSESATKESAGGKSHKSGVRIRTLEEYLNTEKTRRGKDKNRHLYAGDPYAQERNKIGGSIPAAQKTGKPNTNNTGKLGHISAKYEGQIGSVAMDNNGAYAYGKYQFNSGAGGLDQFFKTNPQYNEKFKGLKRGSAGFNAKWSELAKSEAKEFETAQDKAAFDKYFNPNASYAQGLGFKTNHKGVQEAIFSAAINHGGVKKIISAASKKQGFAQMSGQDQVNALYDAREKYVQSNVNSIKGGQKTVDSLLSRYKKERADVLALGVNTAKVQKAVVKEPQVIQPKSQQVAINATNVALNTAKIEPQKVSTPPINGQSNNSQNSPAHGGVATSTGGQIAHAPVRRHVSHPEIASITSGGIVA